MSLVVVAPSPANTGTTITVSDLEDFPATFPFYMAIGAAGQIFDNTNSTNVQVTAITAGVYTIVRNVLGSSPRSILVGDECQLAVSSGSGSGGASIVDAIGDLLVGSGPDALTRLGLGTWGGVLRTKFDGSNLEWQPGLSLIESYITPSSTIASVTINLPTLTAGGSLIVMWGARQAGAYNDSGVWISFNGDGTPVYTERWLGRDSGVYSEGDTHGRDSIWVGQFPGANATANRYGMGIIFIENYRNNNKHKNMIGFVGSSPGDVDNADSNLILGGTWKNVAPISSITLWPTDYFAVSSRFSAWHIGHG